MTAASGKRARLPSTATSSPTPSPTTASPAGVAAPGHPALSPRFWRTEEPSTPSVRPSRRPSPHCRPLERSPPPNAASPAENSLSGSVQPGASPAATVPACLRIHQSRSRPSSTTSPGSPPSSALRASAFAASLRSTRAPPQAGISKFRLPTSPRSPCIRLPRPSMQPSTP